MYEYDRRAARRVLAQAIRDVRQNGRDDHGRREMYAMGLAHAMGWADGTSYGQYQRIALRISAGRVIRAEVAHA